MIHRKKSILRRYKYRKQLVPMIDSYLFFLENDEQSAWEVLIKKMKRE